MSLFIDVFEPLSTAIKSNLNQVIQSERGNQPRAVRRICDTCSKYLDYGELRYDKMEDGIKELNKLSPDGEPGPVSREGREYKDALHILLMAVMNESLDEDQTAINLFTEFSETVPARAFRSELSDFITIGKFATLKQFDLLETAGTIMINSYSDEHNVTDTLSNMYLTVESDEFIPVIHLLLARAREKYPTLLALESLTGFMHIKGKDYHSALDTFLVLKDKLSLQGEDNRYINDNLASVWDNIAVCYLRLGDATKTVESCDLAIGYDSNAVAYRLGLPVLYKKAEAYLLLSQKDQAGIIANQILAANPEDETALELKSKAEQ